MSSDFPASNMSSVSIPNRPVALSATVLQRGRSGVAAYLFGLLDGLRAIAPDLRLHVFGLEDDAGHFERWRDWMVFEPVPAACRSAPRDLLWHQTVLPRRARALGAGCLHIPSYRRIVAAPGLPQVVTIHDLAPLRLEKKYDAARMFYGRRVVPWLARRADAVLAVSETTAADIRHFCHVDPARLRVVHNGIRHAIFFPADAAATSARASAITGSDAPYFLYLARLEHPAKNHVRLIEAFEKFVSATGAPHRLVFGGADWHGAESIHARAAASPLASRIHSLGFVSDDDLPWLYRGAAAMVYPSLFEGFGLPPVEAMACGCPVIASHAGALGEVVGDAARRIDPLDIGDMADALAELATGASAGHWREAGLARAARFTWEATARGVLETYLQQAR